MSRFSIPQDPVFQQLNASIGFDWRLGPYDIEQSRAHAKMLAAAGIISDADRDALLNGLDRVEEELDSGEFPFREDDEDIHMAIERRLTEIAGAGRRQAAHRPLAQRPGGHRRGDVHARARARDGRAPAVAPERAGPARRPPPRLADARLHAPAARAAGLPRPPPARLLLDVPARRAAVRARAGLDLGPAAGRGRAGRRELRHRPRPGGARARLHRRGARTRSTPSRTATSCSTTSPRPPPARRTSRGWAPRSCCGRARSSASARSPTRGRRARRSCRRRRTPTRPSCCGPRRRGSWRT